jgi:hypothetical protein
LHFAWNTFYKRIKIIFYVNQMGFGLWKKIKSGAKKVFGGIGKAARGIWDHVIKPAAPKIVSAAGGIVGGLADKLYPGVGGYITDFTSKFDKQNEDEIGPEPNEIKLRPMVMPARTDNDLVPRLKGRVGANGHGVRNLDLVLK